MDPFMTSNERVLDLLVKKYGLKEVKEEVFADPPTHAGIIDLYKFTTECKDAGINIHYKDNRQRNESKVRKISGSLVELRKEFNGKFLYPTSTWCLFFVTVNGQDARLVDGAHRCEACLRGLHGVFAQVKVYDVASEEDRWNFFLRINESSDLAAVYRDITTKRLGFVKDFLKQLENLRPKWFGQPDYFRRELISIAVPYFNCVDESRLLELTNLIWTSDSSFIEDESNWQSKLLKCLNEINEHVRRNRRSLRLSYLNKIQKEAITRKCRAIKPDGRRCNNGLEGKETKRRVVEKAIFLCGIHSRTNKYESDNIEVNESMIFDQATSSGCYLGLLQTQQEWEDAYKAIINLIRL